MQGGVSIGAAHSCNEMVFEGLDGALGSVAAMHIQQD